MAEYSGAVGAALVLRPTVYIGFRPQYGLEPRTRDFRLSLLLSSLHMTPRRGDIWRLPVFVAKGGPEPDSADDNSRCMNAR
jgi:hypothetical protein